VRILAWFGKWFASPLGILQTFIILAGWILLEKLHFIHDADGYQILYWLTVYSAVTQPVLAFIANKAGEDQGKILAHVEKIVEHLENKP
jgi:hypothetical protein